MTIEEWASEWGVSAEKAKEYIDKIASAEIGKVDYSNQNVIITSRRVEKDAKRREDVRLAVAKHREKDGCNQTVIYKKTSCNQNVNDISNIKNIKQEVIKSTALQTKENTLFSTPEPKSKPRKKENNLSPDELEKHLLNFDLFWKAYPKRDGKKLGKKKAKQIWVKTITPEEAGLVISATGCYAKSKGARDGYAMDATRFLNEEIWRDIETGEQENDNKEGVYL